ncbi:MAG: CvfB family protein [Coraliomargarita sp.]
MAEIGRINLLRIREVADHGMYVDGGEHDTILLPSRYVEPDMRVGDEVEVFVYNDSEDRLVATTEKPFAQVGEFAYLEVTGITPNVGAFLDWGLSKDLLLPYREQGNLYISKGDGVVVAIYLDEYTNRIVASTRLHRHLSETQPSYKANDAVEVLVYDESPLGYKCIVDKQHRGLLFYEETSDKLEPGDQFTGYIKKVRSGGKIDLRRDPAGYSRVSSLSDRILEQLIAAGGELPLNDKSSPDSIRDAFDTSKKAFKQALGALYKQRKIEFTQTGIRKMDTKN